MADSAIIGRVAVKVIPDTKTFRAEAQRELTAIEKSLRDIKVEIEPVVDKERLAKAARDAIKSAEKSVGEMKIGVNLDDQDSIRKAYADVQKAINKLDEVELSIELNRDDLQATKELLKDELDDAYRQVQGQIQQRLSDIQIRPDVDPADARATARKLERLMEQQADLRVRLDTQIPDRERREIERQIDDIQDELDGLEADISVDINESEYRLSQARLAVLARTRIVNLVPVVSKAASARAATALAALSGSRALSDVLGNLRDFFSELDRNLPLIGSMALAVAGLSGWAIAGASNLFALSQSLAQIGGAALALPAIFAGAAISVGVLVAAFKDFNKIFPGIKDRLSELQDAISRNFWSEAEGGIRNLINTLLPQFEKGLKSTATSLGSFFDGLGNSLSRELDGALVPMFDNLNESIDIAGGATDAIARSIRNLGTVGSQYLPRLAGWFVDVANQFDGWLDAAAKDGRLKGWIDTGIQALKDLGNVAKNIGSILAGIANAADAAGGSSLGMMADTLERVAEVVNGPTFQRLLTGVFTAAHDMMSRIAEESGPAFKSFIEDLARLTTKVFPIIGDTIGTAFRAIFEGLSEIALSGGVVRFFEGLRTAVEGLAPAMKPVGRALGDVLSLLGDLASHIGPALGSILRGLANGFSAMAPGLADLIDVLGSALQDLARIAAPLLKTLGEELGKVFEALAPPLEKLFAELLPRLEELRPLIQDILTGLGDALAGVLPPMIELTTAVLPPLLDILNGLSPIISLAASALGLLGKALGNDGFQAVLSYVSPLGQFAIVLQAIATVVQAAADGIGFLADKLSGLEPVMDIFGGLGSVFGAVLSPLNALDSALGSPIKGFLGLSGSAEEAAGSLDTVTRSSAEMRAEIRNLAAGLIGGTASVNKVDQSTRQYLRTLNVTTGAITKKTRALAVDQLKQTGLIPVTKRLGITMKEMVNAGVKPSEQAYNRLSGRLSAAFRQGRLTVGEYNRLTGVLRNMRQATENAKGAHDRLTGKLKQEEISLRNLSKMTGVSSTNLRRMLTNVKANSTGLEFLSDATGISVADLKRLGDQLRDVGKQKVKPKIEAETSAADKALQGTRRDLESLNRLTVKPKIDMGPASQGVRTAVSTAKSTVQGLVPAAAASGTAAGTALGQGFVAGIQSQVAAAQAAAAQIAAAADAAARSRLKIASPSKVFREIGGHAGAGLVQGLKDSGKKVGNEAGLLADVLSDKFWKRFREKLRTSPNLSELKSRFRDVTDDLQRQLDKAFGRKTQAIAKQYDKRLKELEKRYENQPKKLEAATEELDKWRKAAEKAAKADYSIKRKDLVASIQDEFDRLSKVTKEYGEYGNQLDKAKEKLRSLRQEARSYQQSIAQGVIDFGTVVFGGDQDGPIDVGDILDQLDSARDKSKAFARVLKLLKKAGLSQTAIDQLAQAGPEAALASARAILNGGKDAIKRVNELQRQIARAAREAAEVATRSMYQSGLAAAEGLVRGLEKARRPLAQQMRELAKLMVKTIKKELGIKSPSKVFRDLGGFVGQGFAHGIDGEGSRVKGSLDRMAGLRPRSLGGIEGAMSPAGAFTQKVLNYHAAAGSSLGSEEDLFVATNRARMMGW